jgi:hypothetical protein
VDGQADKARVVLSKPQKVLVGVVASGVVVITGLGFAGSYTAVEALAVTKGFGWFAREFPLGVDAGIGVFLAWGDPLAVGMHAVIPTLFVTSVEAARHAVARIASLTSDRHIESPPFQRWLLAPLPTYIIWRRMRMWQLTSYLEVIRIKVETDSFRLRLRSRYGRGWKRQCRPEELLALKLSRYGTPVSATLSAERDRVRADVSALMSPVLSAPVPVSAPTVPVSGGQSAAPAPVSVSAPRGPLVRQSAGTVSAPVSAAAPAAVPAVSAAVSAPVRAIGQPTALADRVRDLKAQGLDRQEVAAQIMADNPNQNKQTLGKTIRRAFAA